MNVQRGFSIFGLVFFVCIIAVIASLAIKVIPPYMDFLTLADATKQTLEKPRMGLMMNDKILEKIYNQLSINNIRIDGIGKDAIQISRQDGALTAEIDYTIEQPIYQNEDVDMNLSMHFVRTVEVRANNE